MRLYRSISLSLKYLLYVCTKYSNALMIIFMLHVVCDSTSTTSLLPKANPTSLYRSFVKMFSKVILLILSIVASVSDINPPIINIQKKQREEIVLSEEFFDGEQVAIEVRVKVIYDGKKGDVINQYVTFTRILDEQVAIYGRTKQAVQETIRICKDKDVMRNYLEKKESEVVDIMMQLYDQEEIWEIHVRGREKDAAIRTAVEMCQDFGMSILETAEKIAAKFNLSKDDAEEVNEYWKE